MRNFHNEKQFSPFLREYISSLSVGDSLITCLRDVFDGICPTFFEISVNDLQMVGPVVQNDLPFILPRQYSSVVSAEIAKMNRASFSKELTTNVVGISDILYKCCFPLRKRVSRSSAVFEGLENCVSFPYQFSFNSSENSQTLGLR